MIVVFPDHTHLLFFSSVDILNRFDFATLLSFSHSSNILGQLCYFCLVLLCFRVLLFIDALRSLAGKGLTC